MSEPRQCGDCTLCCKLMGIQELDKPSNQWCQFVQIGKGCSVYENRPPTCQSFECLWLQGTIPEKFKPNKTHVVMWEQEHENIIQIHIDPDYPKVRNSSWLRTIIDSFPHTFRIVLLEGNRRTLITTVEQAVEAIRIIKEHKRGTP